MTIDHLREFNRVARESSSTDHETWYFNPETRKRQLGKPPKKAACTMLSEDTLKVIAMSSEPSSALADRFDLADHTIARIRRDYWRNDGAVNTLTPAGRKRITPALLAEIVAAEGTSSEVAERFNVSAWSVEEARRNHRKQTLPDSTTCRQPWITPELRAAIEGAQGTSREVADRFAVPIRSVQRVRYEKKKTGGEPAPLPEAKRFEPVVR
ncbi:hypothetical protein KCP91_11990 [Microvirga sp. SRT01]|uniref:Helix-turn-helix DNA binding domain protein n=1 Tax=Sphingomonas longa TaxID=2778730 RepID=A0ABS2D869_9SPHN|nr:MULTISPECIES: hypothetical protein [Alphaproteobacteria]MBM6577093.1 hypothetical protein [Sphingomonas sp. BT552]MBR7710137.1 hypothetical protein [Microvirga sp. SRT01]